MRLALGSHHLRGRRETDVAAGSMLDPSEHLTHRFCLGILDEPGKQILLQRLAGLRCSAPQHCVDLGRNVFDLDARHPEMPTPNWRFDM